ncbi:MAG: hypothetical protein ACAH21_04355 [Ramlibacter sp.]|nr:hypothetical protein [Ramlibacter sp.]
MNIDLLPFSAFALESCGAADPASGETHTLTLPLALTPVRADFEPAMDGILSLGADAIELPALRAAVLPVAPQTVTLTFPV